VARVQVASQAWGYLVNPADGKPRSGENPAFSGTVYLAATGGTTIAAGDFETNSDGQLPGWVEPGTYTITPSDDDVQTVEAVPGAQVVTKDTTTAQQLASALTVAAPTGTAIAADGNLDGAGGTAVFRVGMGLATANGTNGSRAGGDAITTDVANGAGSSQYFGFHVNSNSGSSKFDDKGSMLMLGCYLTVDPYVGGGDVYGEGFGFYAGVTTNRKGALTGAAELQNTVNSGKPARAAAINAILSEANAPPTYTGLAITAENGYTTADFGAASQWLRGARVVDVVAAGAQPVGVGINFRGSFTKAILYQDAAADNVFSVGMGGFVDIGRPAGPSTAIRLFVTGTSKTVEQVLIRADGKITWGGDAALERSGAAVLTVTGTLRNTVGVGTQHVGAATPTGGASGDIRVGTGKIWVNDAGTWKSAAVA
jgi:hypothetical protein